MHGPFQAPRSTGASRIRIDLVIDLYRTPHQPAAVRYIISIASPPMKDISIKSTIAQRSACRTDQHHRSSPIHCPSSCSICSELSKQFQNAKKQEQNEQSKTKQSKTKSSIECNVRRCIIALYHRSSLIHCPSSRSISCLCSILSHLSDNLGLISKLPIFGGTVHFLN